MEEWIKIVVPLIGLAIATVALWFKITKTMVSLLMTMATKADMDKQHKDLTAQIARQNVYIADVKSDLTAQIDKQNVYIAEVKTDLTAQIDKQSTHISNAKGDLRQDIGELRELLFVHVGDHERHAKRDNPE